MQLREPGIPTGQDEKTECKMAECRGNLAEYRAFLDAAADPRIVVSWIDHRFRSSSPGALAADSRSCVDIRRGDARSECTP